MTHRSAKLHETWMSMDDVEVVAGVVRSAAAGTFAEARVHGRLTR